MEYFSSKTCEVVYIWLFVCILKGLFRKIVGLFSSLVSITNIYILKKYGIRPDMAVVESSKAVKVLFLLRFPGHV